MSETTGPGPIVKATVRVALVLTLAVALVFLALDKAAWARGLALGGLASVLNFSVMAWMLPRVLDPVQKGRSWALGSLGLRFGLMGGALLTAFLWPQRFQPMTTAAGLFVVQAALFVDRFILSRLFAHRLGSR